MLLGIRLATNKTTPIIIAELLKSELKNFCYYTDESLKHLLYQNILNGCVDLGCSFLFTRKKPTKFARVTLGIYLNDRAVACIKELIS